MKIQAEIDKKSVNKFNKDIDKLFDDIRYFVSSPATYDTALFKVRKGIKENKLAMKNTLGWAKVKDKLAAEGRIPYKEPLNVTGQLADDLFFKIMNRGPKDLETIGVELTFKDEPRLRPTMKSMYAASKDITKPLEYEMKSSLSIARKLERYTGTINGVNYDITEAMYKLYSQDIEKIVFGAIHKAFNQNK